MADDHAPPGIDQLISATMAMAHEGRPLMQRVGPADGRFVLWDHYPEHDAVDQGSSCRWFYHSHAPEERAGSEHGHFHLFFERGHPLLSGVAPLAGPPEPSPGNAEVVHIAAISIDERGLPTRIFTVNRWVTDEWMLPAAAVGALLPAFDLRRAPGDPLVNAWLGAFVRCFITQIRTLLRQRDAVLLGRPATLYEDRELEIISSVAIDLESL